MLALEPSDRILVSVSSKVRAEHHHNVIPLLLDDELCHASAPPCSPNRRGQHIVIRRIPREPQARGRPAAARIVPTIQHGRYALNGRFRADGTLHSQGQFASQRPRAAKRVCSVIESAEGTPCVDLDVLSNEDDLILADEMAINL